MNCEGAWLFECAFKTRHEIGMGALGIGGVRSLGDGVLGISALGVGVLDAREFGVIGLCIRHP